MLNGAKFCLRNKSTHAPPCTRSCAGCKYLFTSLGLNPTDTCNCLQPHPHFHLPSRLEMCIYSRCMPGIFTWTLSIYKRHWSINNQHNLNLSSIHILMSSKVVPIIENFSSFKFVHWRYFYDMLVVLHSPNLSPFSDSHHFRLLETHAYLDHSQVLEQSSRK